MRLTKDESMEVSSLGLAAAIEAGRLSYKYGKDSFELEDIMKIFSIGMHNARKLMMSVDFPVMEIGSRKVVPALLLGLWIAAKDTSLKK